MGAGRPDVVKEIDYWVTQNGLDAFFPSCGHRRRIGSGPLAPEGCCSFQVPGHQRVKLSPRLEVLLYTNFPFIHDPLLQSRRFNCIEDMWYQSFFSDFPWPATHVGATINSGIAEAEEPGADRPRLV